MVAGAEGARCRDAEAADFGIGIGREAGGVDAEAAGVDWFQPLLAERDPIAVGQAFGGVGGDGAVDGRLEQGEDGGEVAFGGAAGQIDVEAPVLGLIIGDLATGQDDVRIPVGSVLVGEQGGLYAPARGEGGEFPAFRAGHVFGVGHGGLILRILGRVRCFSSLARGADLAKGESARGHRLS